MNDASLVYPAPPAAHGRSAAAARAGTGSRSLLVLLALGLAMFGLALAPRWLTRDTYVTADEDNWMRRAGGFAWGVANGRLGRTYQNGHPGVLTMELAILGQGPGGAERFADPVTGNPRIVTAVPGFFDGLVDARRAFALATAGLVAALAVAAARLLGFWPALFGGLLLALDPFLLAHSQLVHLDALLAGCLALAVVCGVIRWGGGGGRGWVLAGGACSGLALLAKAPAVFLGLWIPLLALWLAGPRGWRRLAADLGLWGAAGLAAFVLLWPSLWVNPLSTLTRMLEFALETGGQPHEQGSYFLGQQVDDPGPLFYPIALALRSSPLLLLGLGLLVGLSGRVRSGLDDRQKRAVLALIASAVAFLLFMTLGAKKFDRYLLPAFPLLDLAAAVGLSMFATAWAARPGRTATLRRQIMIASLGGVLLLALWPVRQVHPHYLAYFNPVFGDGQAAVRAIPVGEGEGLREVAEWLNQRPNADQLHVASHGYDALKATYVGGGEPLRDRIPPAADYIVLYNYQVQIGHAPTVVAELRTRSPLHVVRLNGVEYAWIYAGPRSGS